MSSVDAHQSQDDREALSKRIVELENQVKEFVSAQGKLGAVRRELDDQLRLFRKLRELGIEITATGDLNAIAQKTANFISYELGYERSLVFLDIDESGVLRLIAHDGYYDEWAERIASIVFEHNAKDITLLRDGNEQLVATIENPVEGLSDVMQMLGLEELRLNRLTSGDRITGLLIGGNSGNRREYFTPVSNARSAEGMGNLAGQVAAACGMALSYKFLEAKVQERTAELSEALDKLKELDQAKSAFFANVSHELRTPLTLSIAPLEQMLQVDPTLPLSTQMSHLSVVHNNQLRLLKLINNLLDFAKIEAGRMTARFRPADVVAEVRFFLGTMVAAAEARGIRTELIPDEESLELYLDRSMFEKVIMNLLSNAFKFTPNEGSITIRIRKLAAHAEIDVSDTGIGIPEKALGSLFDRFSQVDSGEKRRYEGTGIGLALVKEYSVAHGGDVRVSSVSGGGTTFTISIPLGRDHLEEDSIVSPSESSAEEERRSVASYHTIDFAGSGYEDELDVEGWGDGVEEEQQQEEGGFADASKMGELSVVDAGTGADPEAIKDGSNARVLVVDDVADMRRFIAQILRDKFTVKTAKDGLDGLDLAKKLRPDLIVSDVMMPRMSGTELCVAVKTDPKLRNTPVILLTAKGDVASKISGLEQGADDFLSKPFNAPELVARSENLVRQRRQEQRFFKVRHELTEARRKLLEGEMALAAEVQATILPKTNFRDWGYASVAGVLATSAACSGDFWFYRRLSSDRVAVVLGDVMGHGVGSAMVAQLAYGALSGMFLQVSETRPTAADVLNFLNRVLTTATEDLRLWLTMVVALVDVKASQVTWANAGHPPVMFKTGTGSAELIVGRSPPLGSDPASFYTDRVFSLDEPRRFLMYSDGITEQVDDIGRAFGSRRLMRMFGHSAQPPSEVVYQLKEELMKHAGNRSLDDDATAVIVDVHGH